MGMEVGRVQIRISGGLYASMLMVLGTVMQYMLLPAPLIEQAGQEAWLAVVGGGLYALVVSTAVVWLASQFPGRDPMRGIAFSLGTWAVLPIVLVYTGLNVVLCAMALHDIRGFTSLLLLFGTPGWVPASIVAAVAIYAVLQGMEVIARVSWGVLPPVLLVLLLLPWGLAREFSVLQVDPFLWKGYPGLFQATLMTWPWSGQCVVVLSLLRHLSPKVSPYRWTLIGVGGSALLLGLTVAVTSLVFGSEIPGRMLYPGFELFAIISVSETIERIQALILLAWLAAGMVKVFLNLFVAVEEVSLAFGIRDRAVDYGSARRGGAHRRTRSARPAAPDRAYRPTRVDAVSRGVAVGRDPHARRGRPLRQAAAEAGGKPAWVGVRSPCSRSWLSYLAAGAGSS